MSNWSVLCYCSIDVIIIASLIGTFVPLLLDKFGIDPALATGLLLLATIFAEFWFIFDSKMILGF
jgi:magnesium transporter